MVVSLFMVWPFGLEDLPAVVMAGGAFFVVVGVAMECVPEFGEVMRRPIRWRKVIAPIGGLLIILGVSAEYFAGYVADEAISAELADVKRRLTELESSARSSPAKPTAGQIKP
jgi:hypothetical protein